MISGIPLLLNVVPDNNTKSPWEENFTDKVEAPSLDRSFDNILVIFLIIVIGAILLIITWWKKKKAGRPPPVDYRAAWRAAYTTKPERSVFPAVVGRVASYTAL